MPFDWTINPYRGCEIGCKYCYARYTHEFMEMRDPLEFETRIFAKQWNPAVFRERLRKIDPWDSIALGTATDPYQPAERRYEVTRSILKVFATMPGRRLAITTKSDLVLRDVDLLVEIGRHSELSVNLTITTLDAELAGKMEPRTARPELRVEALRVLAAAGVRCGVLCCPVMPLINDREEQLDELAGAVRAAGAGWFAGNILFLTTLPRQVFFEFLKAEFPHLVGKYRQAFGRSIGSYQAIQHYIADIATWRVQTELLLYKVAWMQAAGQDCGVEANMLKMVATENAVKAADLGIQILGGMGYSTETHMQRYWRDHRILRMTPISNEMVRNSIAESLGLPRSY